MVLFLPMSMPNNSKAGPVSILWTGGKDSCLALHRIHDQEIPIACLATFVPDGEAEFHAHPITEMKEQAGALHIPIHFLSVSKPYREGYIKNLKWLKDNFNITSVVTGDIDLVEGLPNWIIECCTPLDLEVIRPLWQESRESIMTDLLERGIKAQITWTNHPDIPKRWCGKIIDKSLLKHLSALSKEGKIDLCGENGEYHTMVVDSPLFHVMA